MKSQNNDNIVNELMVNAIIKALKRGNIPVIKAADELAEILQMSGEQVEFSKKKRAPETESAFHRKHQPSAVSSVDGAKILKNIDKLIIQYGEKRSSRILLQVRGHQTRGRVGYTLQG